MRSDADGGWAAKGANPADSCDVGDLAESVVCHDVEGVDEPAPSDTIVLSGDCEIIPDAAWCMVE